MVLRSAVTVSAIPEPIQSSVGSRVMLANGITATEFVGGGGACSVAGGRLLCEAVETRPT